MQRLPVVYRAEALDDIRDIYDAVVELSRNAHTAKGFVERIMARCRKIGDAPRGGRLRDDLAPGLRTVPFEHSAVIAYVVREDCVQITNVFYGGRDFEALYRPDEVEDE
ncbi:toxin ParE1/3/4 [Neorhizobium galegae]|uniref:type II toxin-antitoxin system RelE/ParE family toxin n=1 Tax=Neorhizobium galegae TaxID=399 RepID=UPI001AE5A209|nr:type II toxin-antitoxin system RelE/ParE family toxin [Neorhizobium galegae]MBP2547581.1 toxin ParE1/3/4 [Neorhizobium galegae]